MTQRFGIQLTLAIYHPLQLCCFVDFFSAVFLCFVEQVQTPAPQPSVEKDAKVEEEPQSQCVQTCIDY